MARGASPIGQPAAVIALYFLAACGHDWDTFDPRLAAGGTTATSGSGAAGGEASVSSSSSGTPASASSSSSASTGGGGAGGAGGAAGAAGSGGCAADTLTDAKNCGACGHDCLGGECLTGFCQPVTIATPMHPIGLVATGTELYWGDNANDTITVANKDGTNAAVYTLQVDVRYLATDGTSLFWASPTSIRQRSLGGGPIADLVTGTTIEGLNLLLDTIYFTQHDQGLFSAPKLGGAVTPISVGSAVYAEGVATDSGIVYWCDNGGTISAFDPQNMTTTAFITSEAAPAGLCIYGAVAYWTNQGTGELRSRAIAGGAIQTIVSGLQLPTGVAVDDQAIYWAELTGGVIRRLAR